MQRFVLAYLLFTCCLVLAHAQPPAYRFVPDKGRVLFHDKVDAQQQRIKDMDGKKDDAITLSKDITVNGQVEYAILDRVDALQQKIEQDSALSHSAKVKYILGLETLLSGYRSNINKKDFPVYIATDLVNAYEKAMALDIKKESIEPLVVANSYPVGKILIECFKFPENPGVKPAGPILIEKYIQLHPDEALNVLQRNTDLPSADSLLVQAAHRDLRKFYNYAAVGDRLGARIRNLNDPYVHTIAKMAVSKSGQLYLPFFDMLVNKKISFEELDKVKEDNLAYYRLLVKTRIEFASRMMAPAKDTPMELQSLTRMLSKKAIEAFVNEINGLHDQPDPIRFKCLEPLTPQELYYLCVVSEDVIYTSSYLGVYKRIFEKMKYPRGDSLILSVKADYFRKFIKMSAAYNTLDTLLKSMPAENATSLMKAFMIGLEKTTTSETVEDAVDVADSYSSIVEKNTNLAAFMLDEANWNYDRCAKNNDKNGMVVYRLEKTLFESADTSKKIDLAKELGIPPIYSVDYNSLVTDSGRVIQQVFFYGDEDKDGQNSYANFKALFAGKPEWKMTENENWLTVKSVKGKPVWIFANRPLYGPDDPDAKAQEKLNAYLEAQKLRPTIFIHRGHSYHVKYSLSQIQPSARIVILGSCGGYNNLNEVLTISEDAHIISSKQVGTKTVNEPILKSMNAILLSGKNIEWLPMWKELSKQFLGDSREKFDDYIPPYKNLGAIFIKAYRKAMTADLALDK
ncbi:MAG TPA: hypothetical protein VL307_09495 [Chitinophagaceae bacterium]|nr:hypothetical protein [Chitinophagaceae bacterium]